MCRQEESDAHEEQEKDALNEVKELKAQAALSIEAALALSADTAANTSRLSQECVPDSRSKRHKMCSSQLLQHRMLRCWYYSCKILLTLLGVSYGHIGQVAKVLATQAPRASLLTRL